MGIPWCHIIPYPKEDFQALLPDAWLNDKFKLGDYTVHNTDWTRELDLC